jgi:alpha-mannosidase
VLYKNSHPLDATTKVPSNSRVFAINTLHNYPRQDVVTVPLSGAAGLRGSCAQVSADGKKGYMLMDASDEAVIGQPKGLYADVARVTVAESEPGVFVMTNESLVMKIEDGRIASIYDKAAE